MDASYFSRARQLSTVYRDLPPGLTDKATNLLSHEAGWSAMEFSHAFFLIKQFLENKRSHESIQCAVELLMRWVDEQNDDIDCSHWIGIPHRLLNALKDMESFSFDDALQLVNKLDTLSDKRYRPDAIAFTMVLNMLAVSPSTSNALEVAEELFQRALERGGRDDETVWDAYLHVLAKFRASQKAEEILQEMMRVDLAVASSFAIVLHALANDGRPDRAKALLEKLITIGKLPAGGANEVMFNTCIDAYAKQGNGEQAEKLLDTMLNINVSPDTVTFSSVLNAWAKSKHPEAAERAHRLLMRMETMGFSPIATCYQPVIVAWSASKKPWATKQAMDLLRVMETRCRQGEEHACPTIVTYTAVIHTLARQRDQAAVRHAENLFLRMKEIARSGREDFVMNKIAYSAMIDVLAKSNDVDAPKKALSLLREMQFLAQTEGPHVAPNTITFNAVIRTFAKQGNVEYAKILLEEMLDEVARGNDEVAPDTFSYSALLRAYANWHNQDSPRQALELLEKMEAEYKCDNTKVQPNTVTYTTVIASLIHSKSHDAPERAEAILNRMSHAFHSGDASVKPNSLTLGTVLQVWAASDNPDAPERATALVRWAEAESKDGNPEIKPDYFAYAVLLDIWTKSGRKDAFVRLHEIMKVMYASGDENTQPDVHTYLHLMTAMQNASSELTPRQQLRVLTFLLDAYEKGALRLKPNAKVIHQVLISCVLFRGSRSAEYDAGVVLEEVGRIMMLGDVSLLSTMGFQLFFDACIRLRFSNSHLINELYDLSKKSMKWNEAVEKSYQNLQRII